MTRPRLGGVPVTIVALVVAAALEFRRSTRALPFAGREELLGSGMVPGVSVVTSMYNEEAGIKVAAQAICSDSLIDSSTSTRPSAMPNHLRVNPLGGKLNAASSVLKA